MSATTLSLRWAVFRSGRGAHEDYRVTMVAAPENQKTALQQTIYRLCMAFHSDVEMPPSQVVFLSWKTPQEEWVLTRVTDDPQLTGRRRGLEYLHLILTPDQLEPLGGSTVSLMADDALWESVRTSALSGDDSLVTVTLPKAAPLSDEPLPPPPVPELPDTPESQAILDRWIRLSAQGGKPTAFATWWPSTRTVPSHTFQTVIRAATQRLPDREELRQHADRLATELRAALPGLENADGPLRELVHNLGRDGDMIADQLGLLVRQADRIDTDTWTTRTRHLGALITRVARNLHALERRAEDQLTDTQADTLTELASRYARLEYDLDRQPPPYSFANLALPVAELDREPETAPASPPSRMLLLVGVSLGVLAIGWVLGRVTAPTPAPLPTPTPAPTPSPAPVDSRLTELLALVEEEAQNQTNVEGIAEEKVQRAVDAACRRYLKLPSRGTTDFSQIADTSLWTRARQIISPSSVEGAGQ